MQAVNWEIGVKGGVKRNALNGSSNFEERNLFHAQRHFEKDTRANKSSCNSCCLNYVANASAKRERLCRAPGVSLVSGAVANFRFVLKAVTMRRSDS